MDEITRLTPDAGTDESPSFELLRLIKANWLIVCITTVLATGAAIAVVILMKPVYRATTLLMPAQSPERSGALGGVLGQAGGGIGLLAGLGLGGANETVTTEALALLRSREFIEQFIDRNNLMPKLFPKDWDAQGNRWKPALEHPPTPWKAYRKFVDSVMDVSQDKKTNLITMSIDWTDRSEAAAWANLLVESVNERVRQRAMNDADQTISYLNHELKTADTLQLTSALYTMMESQVKIKAIAAVRKQYAFQVLDPAAPADRDVVLRPRRLMYPAAGLAFGFVAGVAIALLLDDGRKRRSRRAPANR